MSVELWEAIQEYAKACGGDTGQATIGDRRMDAVASVGRALDALRVSVRAEMSAALEAGIEGKEGVYPDWVYAARDALRHQHENTPWLPELLAALGWQGGTLHDALSCVRRLVLLAKTLEGKP